MNELETIQAWEELIEVADEEGVQTALVTHLDEPSIEMRIGGITQHFECIASALGFLSGLSVARKL